MKPAPFKYVRPRALDEACELLMSSDGARLLAGGQSLGPMLNLRLARPEILVDISRLEDLGRFEETDAYWRIGAGVTHAEVEDSKELSASAPMLTEVAAGLAYRSVRNLGTVGGALAHADPAADWPLALAALDAVVQLRARGRQARRIKADVFMQAAFTTELQDGEVIEFVDIPKHTKTFGYCKFCRKQGEYPEASAAVVLNLKTGGLRIFIGALGGSPKPLVDLAASITSRGPSGTTKEQLREAISAAARDLDELSLSMHAAVVDRAIRQAFAA